MNVTLPLSKLLMITNPQTMPQTVQEYQSLIVEILSSSQSPSQPAEEKRPVGRPPKQRQILCHPHYSTAELEAMEKALLEYIGREISPWMDGNNEPTGLALQQPDDELELRLSNGVGVQLSRRPTFSGDTVKFTGIPPMPME